MKKIVVVFDKKSVEKGLVTEDNIRKVIKYSKDKTWNEDDYEDTIQKFQNGSIAGITYMTYDNLRKLGLAYLSYFSSDKKGEIVDLPKNKTVAKNIVTIAKENGYEIYKLRDLLKKIKNS